MYTSSYMLIKSLNPNPNPLNFNLFNLKLSLHLHLCPPNLSLSLFKSLICMIIHLLIKLHFIPIPHTLIHFVFSPLKSHPLLETLPFPFSSLMHLHHIWSSLLLVTLPPVFMFTSCYTPFFCSPPITLPHIW